MTQHPHPPPSPPDPDEMHPQALEQCRETVETQARTIRFLLQNYQSLLDKVGAEGARWSVGDPVNFVANDVIKAGWWIVVSGGTPAITVNNYAGGTATLTVVANLPFFSDGTAVATAALTAVPIR